MDRMMALLLVFLLVFRARDICGTGWLFSWGLLAGK